MQAAQSGGAERGVVAFVRSAADQLANKVTDMAAKQKEGGGGGGDLTYISSFIVKVLGREEGRGAGASSDDDQKQNLDQSYSSVSLTSNESEAVDSPPQTVRAPAPVLEGHESDQDQDPVSSSGEEETRETVAAAARSDEQRRESRQSEQATAVETDEERIIARLPKSAKKMSENDWAFPMDEVKIEKTIASPGQFSKILLAKYRDDKVCVKQVNVHDEVYAVTEIALLRFLSHENVLPLLGAARQTVDGSPTIIAVTEFMAGGSLTDALRSDVKAPNKKKMAFDWKLRVRVALHAARAIEYIHSHGVIHRDIKSDNLLLTSRGDDLVCKLSDFGMARGVFGKHELQDSDEVASSGYFAASRPGHRRAQTICGTDETMAPEMMLHAGDEGQPYTTSVDIFSFGCVLIELCSSRMLSEKGFLDRTPQNGFTFQEADVRAAALPACPFSLLELAVHAVQDEPGERLAPRECREWLDDLTAEMRAGPIDLVGFSSRDKLRRGSSAAQLAALKDKASASQPKAGCCLVS